jgi:hypothetical protein
MRWLQWSEPESAIVHRILPGISARMARLCNENAMANVRIMTDPLTALGLAKTGLVALGAMEQKSMWRDSSNEAEYATSDTGWCQWS